MMVSENSLALVALILAASRSMPGRWS
jgi:hypothetical protein